MQHTPRLLAGATVAKINGFVEKVRKIIKKKQTRRAAEYDAHHRLVDEPYPYISAGVRQNTEEAWIHPVDEQWVSTLRFPPYFLETVKMDKYDCVAPFLDICVDSLLSPRKRASFWSCNALPRRHELEASEREPPIPITVFPMLKYWDRDVVACEENVVRKERGCVLHGEEGWVDGCWLRQLGKPCWTKAIYEEVFAVSWDSHVLQEDMITAWLHSTFPVENGSKMGANRTHWECTCSCATSDRDRRENEGEERFVQYISTKMLPVEHMEEPEILENGRYQALLDKWLR